MYTMLDRSPLSRLAMAGLSVSVAYTGAHSVLQFRSVFGVIPFFNYFFRQIVVCIFFTNICPPCGKRVESEWTASGKQEESKRKANELVVDMLFQLFITFLLMCFNRVCCF